MAPLVCSVRQLWRLWWTDRVNSDDANPVDEWTILISEIVITAAKGQSQLDDSPPEGGGRARAHL